MDATAIQLAHMVVVVVCVVQAVATVAVTAVIAATGVATHRQTRRLAVTHSSDVPVSAVSDAERETAKDLVIACVVTERFAVLRRMAVVLTGCGVVMAVGVWVVVQMAGAVSVSGLDGWASIRVLAIGIAVGVVDLVWAGRWEERVLAAMRG